MHRIYEKGISLKRFGMIQRAMEFLKKHAGQIGYYACVALVLTAVAVAAERLRPDEVAEKTLVLPAVELTTPAPEEPEPAFEVPEGMTELRGYTEQPQWNSIHGQWENHTATDFRCVDGIVRSLSEGVVRTIGRSGIYGGFVEVELNGILIRYASVNPSETLKIDDAVQKGDSLGVVDESMPAEAYLDAHMHLELFRDGKCLVFAEESGKS